MKTVPTDPIRCGIPISSRLAGSGERAPNGKKFDLMMIASTGRVARDGGIIRASAWKDDLSLFRSNPVILWAHDYRMPPIAVAVDVKVDTKRAKNDKKLNGALLEWWRFLTGETDDEWDRFAGRVKALYAVGGMRASSVGFIVREHQAPSQDDLDEAKEMREPTPWWVALRAELLETSAVPVPADPYALAVDRALKAAAVKGADVKDLNDVWQTMRKTGKLPEQIDALADEFVEHRSGLVVPSIELDSEETVMQPADPQREEDEDSTLGDSPDVTLPDKAKIEADELRIREIVEKVVREIYPDAHPRQDLEELADPEEHTFRITREGDDVVHFEHVDEVEEGAEHVIVEAELSSEEVAAQRGLFTQLLAAVEHRTSNPDRSPVPGQAITKEALRRIAREEISEILKSKFGVIR